MKQNYSLIIVTFIALVLVISVHAQQADSLDISPHVVLSTQGDTMIVIHSGGQHIDGRIRHVNIDREIVINADGDTTISVERRSPRMWGRRHRDRGRGHHTAENLTRLRGRHHGHHSQTRQLHLMEDEARRLAREARQAGQDAYPEKEQMLLEQLEKIFDFKQEMRSDALAQQQKDLEVQTLTLEQRQKNKEVIINDRLDQLLGRGSSYNW